MRKQDDTNIAASASAVIADALAIFSGFLSATWLRFDSGFFEIPLGRPDNLYFMYGWGSAIATLMMLAIFRSLGLYIRPQTGTYINKIPKLIRAMTIGIVLTTALAFTFRQDPPFARLVVILSYLIVVVYVLLERWIMFRIEWNVARHTDKINHVLILGTGEVAGRLAKGLTREPRLRTAVVGYLTTSEEPAHETVDADNILGGLDRMKELLEERTVTQVVLADTDIGHKRIVDILLHCEKNLIRFNMIPDLFNIITSDIDVHTIDDIPLIGVSQWPLDFFWNRLLKRCEDVTGALVGLLLSAPVILWAALCIKRSSPGPIFYRQERCGENGRPFNLYKLRTMPVDAEAESGPVWTVEDDPRRTAVGAKLREFNLDELPQFWNVLIGDMSLVGPRPERPHFVEQFKDEITNYMSRHVSKPGITGWAQIHGLRGNTSLEERIKYDLYYLENWSLALDFKILLSTFFTRKNAY